MITRTKLASAGLAAAVALGGLVATPVASAQTTPFANTVQAEQTTAKTNADNKSPSTTDKTKSSLKDTDPDTVRKWIGVVTAGISAIAAIYALITNMGKNTQFRF